MPRTIFVSGSNTAETARDGTIFTTRVLDYYGAPSNWGTFLRDNPYYVIGPVNEHSNRIAGGVDYTVRDWTIHYTIGYQTFDQAFDWTNPVPERSINIDSTANVKELLANGNWSEFRRLDTPSSELFFNGKVTPETDLARRLPLLPLQWPVYN